MNQASKPSRSEVDLNAELLEYMGKDKSEARKAALELVNSGKQNDLDRDLLTYMGKSLEDVDVEDDLGHLDDGELYDGDEFADEFDVEA